MPESNKGPDGKSRAALTNLHTLHANTGYLVKMNTAGTVEVWGKPILGHQRLQAGAYDLVGFPIGPGHAPSAGTFLSAESPFAEISALKIDGTWTVLWKTAKLAPGTAYLVKYAEQSKVTDYTAPLELASAAGGPLPAEGLQFAAGMYGNRTSFILRNRSGSSMPDVTLSLLPNPRVALHYVEGLAPVDLTRASAGVSLGTIEKDSAKQLSFLVQGQAAAGEAVLAITSTPLNVRWLVPVSAAPSSQAGLWAGEVVINDVSQARLGATDETELTVQMAPLNSSGVYGTAYLKEITTNAQKAVGIAITLTLPVSTTEALAPAEVEGLYIRGRVFVDVNQNGKADRTEPGLAGEKVTFGQLAPARTAADGTYLLQVTGSDTPPVEYTIKPPQPAGYTDVFTVVVPSAKADERPATGANRVLKA